MELRFPWESDPAPIESFPGAPAVELPRKRRGRRPAGAVGVVPAGTAAAPDWLYHHLTVRGPAAPLAEFAAAARGAGVIPWRLDFGSIEEDVFNLAVAQPVPARNLTIAGCRILARQFRERVEARQAKAAALVGRSRACPFDLHTLLPVPASILQLGPHHPGALAWLTKHWGTTDGLRHVTERPTPAIRLQLPAGEAVISYGFFTAGTTPRAAIVGIGPRWPALRFRLQPRPAG